MLFLLLYHKSKLLKYIQHHKQANKERDSMQGKIRWSLAKVARASAWQDWLWVGDHFEREREREREKD